MISGMTNHALYWVTPTLGVGPFPSPARVESLRTAEVTDILNVSDARSLSETLAAGFRSVVFIPIADCVPIEPETVTEVLTALDAMFLSPGPRVLVHCLAGQNRSPTVIWLYLCSLDVDATVAKQTIETASPDAVGGHPMLLDAETIGAMAAHRLSRSTETRRQLQNVVLRGTVP